MMRPEKWLVLLSLFCIFTTVGFSAPKAWTYMVFMNADNNLDPFADEDFTEMMKVGSSDWLNIVTLTDREKGPAALHYVEKGKNVKVRELGEVDMGDWKVMVNFVKEAAAAYPARHYALSIWNHGSGWKHQQKVFKGISYDDQSGNHITTTQLGQATREIKGILGRNLDLLTMDACLMQMMEVAWEMQKNVDFIVASEELEPGNGYPYDSHMAGLKATTTPRDFARHMIASFKTAYNGGVYGTEDTTQSAIDCSKLPALKDAIDGWAKTVMAGSFAPAYKQALVEVQKFETKTNIDLWHLIKLLRARISAPEFQTAADKLEKALGEVIVANATTGASMKNAHGLAIYFPKTNGGFDNEYLSLALARDSLYDEMMKDYYRKVTAAAIVKDLEKGNVTSLRAFVAQADASQKELNGYVADQVRFHLFTEANRGSALVQTVTSLLEELKGK